MHHLLSFSKFFISDSQSMSVEAAILGVPSIRVSTFAGKISVLEELEHKYELTFGVKPENPDMIFKILKKLFKNKSLSQNIINKRNVMIREKIDVSAFLYWFIESYPHSVQKMKNNNNYQYRFK